MVKLNENCSGCKEPLSEYQNNYVCDECSHKYQLCEACLFSEDTSHPHKLEKIVAKARNYPYFVRKSPKKSANGAELVLGSYSAALPKSFTIVKKNIKAVLSLLEFDTTKAPISPEKGSLEALHSIFFPSGNYSPLVVNNGVLYFHINVPDLADPSQLGAYGCEDLLPSSVLFIEYAMRLGNVLVHCEKGQRRSPTVFLAWLCLHKISLVDAIDEIAINYEGDEDWGESYKRHRSLWINGPLDKWQSKSKSICKKWIDSHRGIVKSWSDMCFINNPKKVLVKRKRRDFESDENKPTNNIKKQKCSLKDEIAVKESLNLDVNFSSDRKPDVITDSAVEA